MNLKVKIEELKLESDIVYSQIANNYGETIQETEEESKFRQEVESRVRLREREIRQKKIQELMCEMKFKEDKFYYNFIIHSSIKVAGEKLDEAPQNLTLLRR